MLVVSAAYVLHDVKEFGSFQASRTGRIYTSVLQHETVVQAYETARVGASLIFLLWIPTIFCIVLIASPGSDTGVYALNALY